MAEVIPYNRTAAVQYAHRWAYERNPRYYDYSKLGGDCTNFVSQCLYTGTGVMNYTQTFGWYYIDGNHKAPAWTGVPYFFNFVTRKEHSAGPFGVEVTLDELELGDFVQLQFPHLKEYTHTPIVVERGYPATPDNVLLAAHSVDSDWRPLSSYTWKSIRCLHIQGAHP